ncbi:unnamed protein product [Heligmosomoides polygyrus]|uniref:MULE transposase domain-containing protein n=1 Tax=Heligmosomoides polygyrus TaxID=6339 RepID=A0A3P7TRD6_HELPZ|nr:unnamed protein product [Heligmosomoides polygyrus]
MINKFNLRPGCHDNNDITSLSMRVEEKNPDDGIRLYEPPKDGKGLQLDVLVIITPLQLQWLMSYSSRGVSLDDTHHTTRYTIKLAFLMVADEKNRGLPAAFLLSSSMTTADVTKLFEVIRDLMPEFAPRTMVTDEAPCFWNGFRTVLGSTGTRLHYCRTHIAKTWEKKPRKWLRNANSRLDSLVDLLIKAVEDKSESKEIMDRRRLVKSAYRAKETNKCHRKAVAYYAERQENIRSEGERRWSVESMTQGKFFTVEYKGACSCKFMTCAAIEMRARSLAKTDTDDALHKLDKILELLHLAAAVEAAPPDQMPPRPELAKEGGKPRLQKAALQPRAKVKKRQPKVVSDLHEEVRRLRTVPSANEVEDDENDFVK